ncbi:MAG: ribosome-associated translation inhibitor RaiA, partial [Pigmentiphaga sp.]
MNLSISGHQLDITPAIREYVTTKLARVLRHFEHIIDTQVILSAA